MPSSRASGSASGGAASAARFTGRRPSDTDAAHGAHEVGRARVIGELAAQVGDVDVDEVVVAEPVLAPDALEQLRAGEGDARRGGERVQEVELDAGEVELDAVELGLAGGGVDGEGAERADDVRGRAAGRGGVGAAEHGFHAADELGDAEGLGDVVVGAGLEADDLVQLGVLRGEHQDVGVAELAHPPADLDAVDVGQAEVEDDQVERVQGGRLTAASPSSAWATSKPCCTSRALTSIRFSGASSTTRARGAVVPGMIDPGDRQVAADLHRVELRCALERFGGGLRPRGRAGR